MGIVLARWPVYNPLVQRKFLKQYRVPSNTPKIIKEKFMLPKGYITVAKAATLSHLDSSSVRKWCRKITNNTPWYEPDVFACYISTDSHKAWFIHKASFMKWVKRRRKKC